MKFDPDAGPVPVELLRDGRGVYGIGVSEATFTAIRRRQASHFEVSNDQ